MADGSTKAIADIELGDYVLAEDPETGERGSREVTKLWIHEDQITDLELADGSRVSTTEDHPFWNHTDSEWQRADALDPGDLLLSADGDLLAVDGIDPASTRRTTAYNLTVDDIHTYFVRIGTEDILVHNTCPPLRNIPADADIRVLKPDPKGGAQYGVESKWRDAAGNRVRFRMHGPDATAPPGSNAAMGPTYRVQVNGR